MDEQTEYETKELSRRLSYFVSLRGRDVFTFDNLDFLEKLSEDFLEFIKFKKHEMIENCTSK